MNLTNKIIILSVLTFIIAIFLPQKFVSESFFFSLGNFLEGNVYVTVTALFMHANIAHIFINMIMLLLFGTILEDLIGVRRFALVYFLGGMAAFLLSGLAYGRGDLLVGASGSIFTVMAVLFVMNPLAFKKTRPYSFVFGRKEVSAEVEEVEFNRFTFFLDLLIMIFVQFTLIALYNPITGDKGVGNLGHFVGFSIGFVFGIAWSDKWRKYAKAAGSIFIIFLLLSIVGVYAYYIFAHARDPGAQTFVDRFFSGFSIEIFQSERAKCNNFCIESDFDYGVVENGFCTCMYNITI